MTYFMYHQINVLVIVPMILTPTQSFIFQQSDLLRDILPSNDAGDLIPADTIAEPEPWITLPLTSLNSN